jgi:DNA modification methylase
MSHKRTVFMRGDCRAVLATLPAESVHCVVTSPPYWGLRDYGIPPTVWGGEAGCAHEWVGSSTKTLCRHCGAWRGAFGLEPTYRLFVEHAVEVFREVRRVLRPDGMLWLNLGDSYAASSYGSGGGWAKAPAADGVMRNNHSLMKPMKLDHGLKPKDLCGIPWRVAFALQADGWYLRQDIIWHKPNPMPESVTDRCTKAHEYLFLLSKSPRYYFDAEAIKEPAVLGFRISDGGFRGGGSYTNNCSFDNDASVEKAKSPKGYDKDAGRNKRSVWQIATSPFPEAHFATFPPALVEPCIKAGTSEKGCCAKCGAPWVRETEKRDTGKRQKMADGWDTGPGGHGTIHRDGREKGEADVPLTATVTLGWSPSCKCDAAVVPCTVLDPFAGAGTTGLVADRLQHNAILIELSPHYLTMAKRRIVEDAPLFTMD